MLNKIFIATIILFSTFTQLQANNLIMVRCDNGNSKLLKSPTDIDLSQLQAKFNPNLDTVFLIHGHMNTHESAEADYKKAVSFLKPYLKDKNYVGFYWPSDALWFGTAVDIANRTGAYAVHILGEISRWYGESDCKIHLLSHSLGGRVLLNTLKQNSSRYVKWGACFPMAAAVHSISYQNSFIGTNLTVEKTWAYHSKNDDLLIYLYPLYYWLFPDTLKNTPQYQKWQKMTLEEKIQYLRSVENRVRQGHRATNEFDRAAYQQIQKAEREAMGLVGAVLSGQIKVIKVTNVDVSDIVTGHAYWNNKQVMTMIGKQINSLGK